MAMVIRRIYENWNLEREENREELLTTKDTKYAKVFNIFGWIVLQIFPFIGRLEPLERFERLEPFELMNLVLTHHIRVFYDPFSR